MEIHIVLGIRCGDVDLWGYLWKLSSMGQVKAIIGGPPCRTVSGRGH